jgi:superfamily II DNA or RNA helicase
MNSLEQVLNSHAPAVRARGRDYCQAGRVKMLEQSGNRIEAVVRGTLRYRVEFKGTQNGWTHHCTCPAHADRSTCKHVCAVIFQVEADRRAQSLGESRIDTTRPLAGSRRASPGDVAGVSGVRRAKLRALGSLWGDDRAEAPDGLVDSDEDDEDDDDDDDGASEIDEGEDAEGKLETLNPAVHANKATLRVAPEEESTAAFDARLNRLLSDKSIPKTLKDNLFRQLLNEKFQLAGRRPPPPKLDRAQQLLATLEVNHPLEPTTAARRLALRYVLSPRAHPSTAVGIAVQGARIDRRGEVGPYKTLYGPPSETDLDETDRMAAAVLIDGPRERGTSYSYPYRPAEYALQPALQRLLLPKLAEERRLCFATVRENPSAPLEFDAGPPWEFRLDVESARSAFVLEGALERAGLCIPCAEIDCALTADFAIARGKLLRVEWHGAMAWAVQLGRLSKIKIPRERASDLARVLSRAPLPLPVHAAGLVEQLAGPMSPILGVLAPAALSLQLEASIEFEYAGERLRRGGPSVLLKGARVLRVARDAEAESRAEAQFAAAGGKLRAAGRRVPPAGRTDAAVERSPIDGSFERKRFGALVHALVEQGWRVEGAGRPLRTQGSFDLAVSSGIDWFDVSAEIEFEGAGLELPALLEALAERRSFVRLSDGSYGLVPEEWLEQWTRLATLGEVEAGVLRVKRSRAFLLDTLLAERGAITCDAEFTRLRQRLAQARAPQPAREPAGFQGELRPYQRAGLGWLGYLGEIGLGGCLADDMGLGKTVQLLALMLKRKRRASGPTLVVAPKTLLFNWEREAQRFTPQLAVRKHHGLERARDAAAFADAELVLTTYGTLRQDLAFIKDVRFDLVVLDEAQAIKNARSQSAKAVRLLQAELRFALTGTPIENRVEDLLSIFEFLNPGLLEGSRVLRHLLDGSDRLATARLTARALGPFLLRRTKEQVLSELPGKSEQLLSCELEGVQRREYDALRDYYRGTLLAKVDEVGIEKAGMNVLEALLRLRQAACHLALVDKQHAQTPSAKLETLVERLSELRESGHKALVFSQFTSFLALVRPELDARKLKYEYLDGKTRDREAKVARFQSDPDTSVFLISLKAGGVGLNLTSADYVFLLDPWWNPAVERQAVDRAHRIGQTRPVTAYRIVASDTVEAKVLELQQRKRELADALFEGTGHALRELTRADLEALLA